MKTFEEIVDEVYDALDKCDLVVEYDNFLDSEYEKTLLMWEEIQGNLKSEMCLSHYAEELGIAPQQLYAEVLWVLQDFAERVNLEEAGTFEDDFADAFMETVLATFFQRETEATWEEPPYPVYDYRTDIFMPRDWQVDYVDGGTTYYVPVDERDLVLASAPEGKPKSAKEVVQLAEKKGEYEGVQSSEWAEEYGAAYHIYHLPEHVGFDATSWHVVVESIDADALYEAIEKYRKSSYKSLPRIVVRPCASRERAVELPWECADYASIEVTLSPYASFVFKKMNNRKDIFLLHMNVEPVPGHVVLGNLRNYNLTEMRKKIRDAEDMLYSLTGIKIMENSERISTAEINLTWCQKVSFSDLRRPLLYCQRFCDPRYKGGVFAYQKGEEVSLDGGTTHKTMAFSGLTLSADTVAMKLYDKKLETAVVAAYPKEDKYRKKMKHIIRFEDEEQAIIRLEYKIHNVKQLTTYLGNPYLVSLTQDDLEQAFHKLTRKFFITPYEHYSHSAIKILTAIIKNLDTSKTAHWREELLRQIYAEELFVNSTPALLSEHDLDEIIRQNPLFSKHPTRYKKVVQELLVKSEAFTYQEQDAYQILANFFNKTYKLQTLSNQRRIGYVVDVD